MSYVLDGLAAVVFLIGVTGAAWFLLDALDQHLHKKE